MDNINDVFNKANKCLNCKKPTCRKGCPIATRIPDFITQIKEKNFAQAYNILQENNIMSQICSTVCPVEKQCMGSCIRGVKGEPIEINYLERFINNWAKANNIKYEIKITNNSNKKIAIIGAGPAGIACAIELRKSGADVTIFEKEENCGGILEYGIPDFRLSKDIIKELIDKIKLLGVEIKTHIEFGKDIRLVDLKEQGYTNIFLAMGAEKQSTYKLTKEKTNSIYESDAFLKKYNKKEKIEDLGVVVVIGGGNVAFDCSRSAVRMGAKETYILYRRNEELMPASKSELNDAINDGVKIIFQTRVINGKAENNQIKEIECIKTKIEDTKAIDIENSNFKMKVNTIVFAIGSKANEELLEKINIKTEKGLVCVDENYMTNIKGIYAGGDLVETKSSVCRAIATGKKAAKAILEN